MLKKMAIIMVMVVMVMIIGCGNVQTTATDPIVVETEAEVQIYDVVETYDDTMIIETENGEEALQFDGMTEAEMYALHVIFVNGKYVGIAD